MRSPQSNLVGQRVLPLLVAMCIAIGEMAWGQATWGQEVRPQDPSNAQLANREEPQREPLEDGTPELGVVVSGSPGRGVLITEVVSGSPASEASLRAGDFILSVDGQEVSTPAQLRQTVRAREAGSEIQVVVWRAGEESTHSIVLARQAPERSTQSAWLGVFLSPAEGEGARIDQVYPRSPADRGGLRPGDVVIGVNDQQITSVAQLVELIQGLEPDAKIELKALRGQRELEMTVTLGAAPVTRPRLPFRSWRHPLDLPELQRWLTEPRRDRHRELEDALEELRHDVEKLREQVRELRGDPAEIQEESDNPGQQHNNPGLNQSNPALQGNNPGSAGRVVQSNQTGDRQYYQDYGHYYRFQRPPSRSLRSREYPWPSPSPYSYYPYGYSPYGYNPYGYYPYGSTPYAPPYTYYRDEGRTYYYLAPEGPRFGARIGPYWFEYAY